MNRKNRNSSIGEESKQELFRIYKLYSKGCYNNRMSYANLLRFLADAHLYSPEGTDYSELQIIAMCQGVRTLEKLVYHLRQHVKPDRPQISQLTRAFYRAGVTCMHDLHRLSEGDTNVFDSLDVNERTTLHPCLEWLVGVKDSPVEFSTWWGVLQIIGEDRYGHEYHGHSWVPPMKTQLRVTEKDLQENQTPAEDGDAKVVEDTVESRLDIARQALDQARQALDASLRAQPRDNKDVVHRALELEQAERRLDAVEQYAVERATLGERTMVQSPRKTVGELRQTTTTKVFHQHHLPSVQRRTALLEVERAQTEYAQLPHRRTKRNTTAFEAAENALSAAYLKAASVIADEIDYEFKAEDLEQMKMEVGVQGEDCLEEGTLQAEPLRDERIETTSNAEEAKLDTIEADEVFIYVAP